MTSHTNEELIHELKEGGYLKTSTIQEAFRIIDRAFFVPEEYRRVAYENHPLPIGFGQTISQPLTVAFMLSLVEPKVGEKILDIGMGSGWQAALLAFLVGEHGSVVGVERVPELAGIAEKNLEKTSGIKKGSIKVVLGDGTKGYSADAPYDKIIAAASGSAIPTLWKEQLKIGGRIVAPVGQGICVLNKTGPNEFTEQNYFGFSFVPLVEQ